MEYRRYEDLEEDLQEEQRVRKESVDEASRLLEPEDFHKEDELNGVSFKKSYENEDITYHCQFYIDTEADKYSSYVTSEEYGDKNTSFSQSGHIADVAEALDKFIKFVRTLK